jgi:hypothetical protein
MGGSSSKNKVSLCTDQKNPLYDMKTQLPLEFAASTKTSRAPVPQSQEGPTCVILPNNLPPVGSYSSLLYNFKIGEYLTESHVKHARIPIKKDTFNQITFNEISYSEIPNKTKEKTYKVLRMSDKDKQYMISEHDKEKEKKKEKDKQYMIYQRELEIIMNDSLKQYCLYDEDNLPYLLQLKSNVSIQINGQPDLDQCFLYPLPDYFTSLVRLEQFMQNISGRNDKETYYTVISKIFNMINKFHEQNKVFDGNSLDNIYVLQKDSELHIKLLNYKWVDYDDVNLNKFFKNKNFFGLYNIMCSKSMFYYNKELTSNDINDNVDVASAIRDLLKDKPILGGGSGLTKTSERVTIQGKSRCVYKNKTGKKYVKWNRNFVHLSSLQKSLKKKQ